MMSEVSRLDLETFIRALGEDSPAPGAGAAGGVALGMAAACAAKAFAISARRLNNQPQLSQAAEKARGIALMALGAADWDAQDYTALLKAGTDRLAAKQTLERDGEAQLGLAAALDALLKAEGGRVIPMLDGDLAAARALLAAFDIIGRGNLRDLA
jgi:formiminotetrahydrofolate cyclodeaminase